MNKKIQKGVWILTLDFQLRIPIAEIQFKPCQQAARVVGVALQGRSPLRICATLHFDHTHFPFSISIRISVFNGARSAESCSWLRGRPQKRHQKATAATTPPRLLTSKQGTRGMNMSPWSMISMELGTRRRSRSRSGRLWKSIFFKLRVRTDFV